MKAIRATPVEAWKDELLGWRREKDRFFASSPDSPLASAVRKRFTGLSYFKPEAAWRVTAAARRLPAGDAIALTVSRGGGTQAYVRYARATIASPTEGTGTLDLFAPVHEHQGHEPHEPHELFVPFRDVTSGTTTYPAGRYLEVQNPFDAETPEAEVLIDFNFAYNPFCAYSERYVCPLPPKSNWLAFPVDSGERYDPTLQD